MSEAISFPEWLRRRRRVLGLTQHALAARVPCSPSLLRKYEAGERRPSQQVVARLAEALQLPAEQHAQFSQLALFGARANPADMVPARAMLAENLPGTLPIPPTPLFGREAAADAVGRIILGHPGRLVTLVGAPGVGKTRLALRVATDLQRAFADGARFVPLGALAEPELVGAAIWAALGEQGPQPGGVDGLVAALRPRQLLLLLDNFEHLLAAAPLMAELLSACPGLHLLATSREPLRLRAERRFGVLPLALPAGPDDIGASPAVQLFVERAQAVEQRFVLNAANALGVAAICAHLDGLPLAIELAAGRSDELAPAELLALLDARLPTLVDGPRDLPARQRTLRATIDWSYSRLGPAEAHLFALLSVFAGGATPTAVAAVADLTKHTAVRLLDQLVRKNLVQRQPQPDGSQRVLLLETLREYAEERLAAAGATAEARRRHAAHYVACAEELAPTLISPDTDSAVAALDRELNNLRAALAWSAEHDGGLGATRLCVALDQFWAMRGHWRELTEIVAPLLDGAPPLPAELLASALQTVGYILSQHAGDIATTRRAVAFFERSLTIWRALGRSRELIRALDCLAMMARYPGNEARTSALLEESLALQRELGLPASGTLNQLGMLRTQQGDYTGAEAAFAEALVSAQPSNQPRIELVVLINLAEALRRRGDLAQAQQLFSACLEQGRRRALPEFVAEASLGLGQIAACEGALIEAAASVATAAAGFREFQMRAMAAHATLAQAQIALLAEAGAAATFIADALSLGYETFSIEVVAHGLAVQAALAAQACEDEHAARQLGAADGLRARFTLPPDRLDTMVRARLEPARARLGIVRFERCRAAAAAAASRALPSLAFPSAAEAVAAIDLRGAVAAGIRAG